MRYIVLILLGLVGSFSVQASFIPEGRSVFTLYGGFFAPLDGRQRLVVRSGNVTTYANHRVGYTPGIFLGGRFLYTSTPFMGFGLGYDSFQTTVSPEQGYSYRLRTLTFDLSFRYPLLLDHSRTSPPMELYTLIGLGAGYFWPVHYRTGYGKTGSKSALFAGFGTRLAFGARFIMGPRYFSFFEWQFGTNHVELNLAAEQGLDEYKLSSNVVGVGGVIGFGLLLGGEVRVRL